ncbi:phytanoyl-CoA dioxygenase [Actinoplanes sp. NPDC048796]|uniref:phytanoyl-CoA dioxygenase n=1 Tax=Actinoplanes sp. NPDC048796 TaxID=3155640 RepID=UPI0033EE37F5
MREELIEDFVLDGFVKVPGAFSTDIADACATLLWEEIDARPDEPATWTQPVYWVGDMPQEPFVQAANTPVLHDAFDALVGPGRWSPRPSMGSFPLRFPHAQEPNDAGWHIEGGYQPPGETEWWTNVHSSGKTLLMLFLFSEIDESNAPTRIRIGSHLDVPEVLRPYGGQGAPMSVLGPLVDAASTHRRVTLATGQPGDVYLCHPFLVHAAQPHHGSRPRFLGQPPLHPSPPFMPGPFSLSVTDTEPSPIGRTIRQALGARSEPSH